MFGVIAKKGNEQYLSCPYCGGIGPHEKHGVFKLGGLSVEIATCFFCKKEFTVPRFLLAYGAMQCPHCKTPKFPHQNGRAVVFGKNETVFSCHVCKQLSFPEFRGKEHINAASSDR